MRTDPISTIFTYHITHSFDWTGIIQNASNRIMPREDGHYEGSWTPTPLGYFVDKMKKDDVQRDGFSHSDDDSVVLHQTWVAIYGLLLTDEYGIGSQHEKTLVHGEMDEDEREKAMATRKRREEDYMSLHGEGMISELGQVWMEKVSLHLLREAGRCEACGYALPLDDIKCVNKQAISR